MFTILFCGIFSQNYAQNYESNSVLVEFVDKANLPTEITNNGTKSYSSAISSITNILNGHQIENVYQAFPSASKIKHPKAERLERIYVFQCQDCDVNALKTSVLSDSTHFNGADLIPMMEADFTPNDYGGVFDNCSCGNSLYDCTPDYLNAINAEDAWDITKGNRNVRIGIIDHEFRLNHEELRDKIDYHTKEYNCTTPPADCNHGTYVAAFAAADTDNGDGTAAIGFNCGLELYGTGNFEFADGGWLYGYNYILEAVARGVRIINWSWGYCEGDDSDESEEIDEELTEDLNLIAEEIIDIAFDHRTTVIATAGNGINTACEGGTALFGSTIQEMYDDSGVLLNSDDVGISYNGYRYPASFDNAISVSGVTNDGYFIGEDKYVEDYLEQWTSLSHNDKVDIVAPAYGIGGIHIDDNKGSCHTGTSFAAPIVAGTVGLLLSENPCLHPTDIKFLLQDNADKSIENLVHPESGISNANYYTLAGYNNSENIGKIGMLDAYAAVNEAANYVSTGWQTYTLTDGVNIWENDDIRYVGANIIVESGQVLIIRNSTLMMQSDTEIIVQNGGKLIVENSRITNGCAGQSWGGIAVSGRLEGIGPPVPLNPPHTDLDISLVTNEDVLPNDYPGVVIVTNDSYIEKGGINGAIRTKNGSDIIFPSSYGGIILADNSTFVMGRFDVGVVFHPYENENISSFDNCTFEFQDVEAEGVKLYDVQGVEFKDCSFIQTTTPKYNRIFLPHTIGIHTFDASFGENTNNEAEIRGCYFEGLDRGIAASSSGVYSELVIGKENSNPNAFINNHIAVNSLGVQQLTIENNIVDGGHRGFSVNGQGDISINGNSISNITREGPLVWRGIGVLLNQTGDGATIIKCNIFDDTTDPIYFLANNEGAIFKDNVFDEADFNVSVAGAFDNVNGNLVVGEINTPIGSNTNPVANLFFQNSSSTDIYTGFDEAENSTTVEFEYFHLDADLNPRLEPRCDQDGACVISYNFDAQSTNINDYNGCIDDIEATPPPDPPTPCITKNCFYDIKFEFDETIKPLLAGNSFELAASVETEPTSNQTYLALVNASPFMSDGLLREMTGSTEMESWMKEDILVRNAPLSDSLMIFVQDRVSDYAYQVLYSIKYYEDWSERDLLEMTANVKEREKKEVLSNLLRQSVSEKNIADAEELLLAENTVTSKHTLAGIYIGEGDFVKATDVINSIDNDVINTNYQRDIQSINAQMMNEGLENYSLSSTNRETLERIANSVTFSSVYARAILEWVDGQYFETEVPPRIFPSGKKEKDTYRTVPLLKNWDMGSIRIAPNPVQTQAMIYLSDIDRSIKNELVLYNSEGQQLKHIVIVNEQKVVQIDTYDLSNGIYLLTLLKDGKATHQEKMIVIK